MAKRVTLRRAINRLSGVLDETSAELDRLALVAVDDAATAQDGTVKAINRLAALIDAEVKSWRA